jgi:cell division protein FtsB
LSRLGSARADSLRPVLGGVVLLFVVLLGAAGLKSWRDLNAARAREKQLETRIETARAGIDHLRGRIERLRSDPAMLERLAREDLGLVEPRDVVIELPQPDRGAAPPPAAAPVPIPAIPARAPAATGAASPPAPASSPPSSASPASRPAAPPSPAFPASSPAAPPSRVPPGAP